MQALIKKIPQHPPRWYTGLELKDVSVPVVSEMRPVKVSVVSAGICGTDVGIYLGKESLANEMSRNSTKEIIIGHEFCGIIEDILPSARKHIAALLYRRKNFSQEVVRFLQGRSIQELSDDVNLLNFLKENFYVTAEMHIGCGQCLQCRIGCQHVCKNIIGKGLHEDGAFSQYMVLPANRIILFEKSEIPKEIISFMDALGNAVHVAQAIDLVGKSVLITGAGVQGLLSCAVARMLGANIIFITDVSINHENKNRIDKLHFAAKLGADYVFDVSEGKGKEALFQTIQKVTDKTGVDIVFEMSGSYQAYSYAFQNIRMGGSLVLLGLPAGRFEVDFSKDIIFKGLKVFGIYGRRIFDTWDMMRFLLNKRLTKIIMESGIITHQLPMTEFEEGFKALISGEAIKVLLRP